MLGGEQFPDALGTDQNDCVRTCTPVQVDLFQIDREPCAAARVRVYDRSMDATHVPVDGAGAGMASPERALLSDARVALGVLNWARHRVVTRTFGASRDQVTSSRSSWR
jgi:hypothetical protein